MNRAELIEASATAGPLQRLRAVAALADHDGEDVAAALERALTDRRWFVRRAAAQSLAQVDPGRQISGALQRLTEMERGSEPGSLAAEEIARLGLWGLEEANAVAKFTERIEAKDPLRGLYIELLGEIGDRSALPVLTRAAADENAAVRATVMQALKEFNADESHITLGKALGDPNRDVRKSARESLIAHGEGARMTLQRIADSHGPGSEEAANIVRNLDR